MKMQAQITAQMLMERGYTVRAAARAINKSVTHVYYVVTGVRASATTQRALAALPQKCVRFRRQQEGSLSR